MATSLNLRTLLRFSFNRLRDKDRMIVEQRLASSESNQSMLSVIEQQFYPDASVQLPAKAIWERIESSIEQADCTSIPTVIKPVQHRVIRKHRTMLMASATASCAAFLIFLLSTVDKTDHPVWKDQTGRIFAQVSEFTAKTVTRLQLSRFASITAQAQTTITLRTHMDTVSKKPAVTLSLHAGTVQIALDSTSFKHFSVSCGSLVITPSGTEFTVMLTKDSTTVSVQHGAVSVHLLHSGETRHIAAGSQENFSNSPIPVAVTNASLKHSNPETLHKTNHEKIQYLQTVEMNNGSLLTGTIIDENDKEIRIITSNGTFTLEKRKIKVIRYVTETEKHK